MIACQQLSTIVVATNEKTIKEFYVDYENNDYILNDEKMFEQYINSISVEENYLFVSA